MKCAVAIKPLLILCLLVVTLAGCKKSSNPKPAADDDDDTVVVPPPAKEFDINSIKDTYGDIAAFTNYQKWTVYNVHDPSIKKFGDYYYSYSTDVGYGIEVRSGIQIRRSKDLVEWQYVGWVFSDLPAKGSAYIQSKGGTPFNALWAPYVIKHGSEYRLYYSLSSGVGRLSVIGLATAASPDGPWTEKDIVVISTPDSDGTRQTNAIDPTVITTPEGEQWLYYGSGWDGIYIVKLNPATGLAAATNDKGIRIANRGFTGGRYNGNIEAPEIIYNAELKKYYLFISYDWIDTKYNVRVAKGDSPQGPFYDFNGHDINVDEDHGPMILAPYKFSGHSGYQGTAHCAVFDNGAGQYYIAHQGRPGIDKYYMNLHVRKLEWTEDGWPVVLPERYANVAQTAVAAADIAGNWERIALGYRVVVGYSAEQTSPDFQNSTAITLSADGKISGAATGDWTYNAPWLELKWTDGTTDKVKVVRERNWQDNVVSTLVFTGLNNNGTAIWGKKK